MPRIEVSTLISAFKSMLRDRLEFRSPLGLLGVIADKLVLTAHMRRFLLRRNAVIKQLAESDAGRRYLDASE
jgi:ligand-binding SRPBCC domain-containing protein